MKCILLTTDPDLREMNEFLKTLKWTLVTTISQIRPSPDPRYFLGRGKIDQLADMVTDISSDSLPHDLTGKEVDHIIVNAELQPNQRFNLEQALHREVYDRIRVILEIFRHRSVSEEARLQVELATLRYEIPWIREVVHQSRSRERPGWHAGGEYPTRQHIARAHRRQRQIQKRLVRLECNREMMRSNRRRRGFVLASITGYTNAGKSTLFNALTSSSVLVDDRMFATLSTTTRRFGYGRSGLLLTDTIGFLKDLPPWMVRAFNATLEEIHSSDIVVLVLDASEPEVEILRKTETCLTLLSTGVPPSARSADIPGNVTRSTLQSSSTGVNPGSDLTPSPDRWHTSEISHPVDPSRADELPTIRNPSRASTHSIPREQTHGFGQKHTIKASTSSDPPVLIGVLSKIDLLDDHGLCVRMELIQRTFPDMDIIPVSVPCRVGLDRLREKLVSMDRALRPDRGGTRNRSL